VAEEYAHYQSAAAVAVFSAAGDTKIRESFNSESPA
jgi:hypothetical protein